MKLSKQGEDFRHKPGQHKEHDPNQTAINVTILVIDFISTASGLNSSSCSGLNVQSFRIRYPCRWHRPIPFAVPAATLVPQTPDWVVRSRRYFPDPKLRSFFQPAAIHGQCGLFNPKAACSTSRQSAEIFSPSANNTTSPGINSSAGFFPLYPLAAREYKWGSSLRSSSDAFSARNSCQKQNTPLMMLTSILQSPVEAFWQKSPRLPLTQSNIAIRWVNLPKLYHQGGLFLALQQI